MPSSPGVHLRRAPAAARSGLRPAHRVLRRAGCLLVLGGCLSACEGASTPEAGGTASADALSNPLETAAAEAPLDPDGPATAGALPSPGGTRTEPRTPQGLAAIGMSADASPPTLSFTGCDISKLAYMQDAAEAYRAATGIRIEVTGGGATRGIRATVGGYSDFGGTCRHALDEEFPEDEAGAVLTHVAWDALVFFTHPSNPVDDLSTEQVKGILLGRIVDWSEVGGEPSRIVPAFRRASAEGALSGVAYMTNLLLFGETEVPYTGQAVQFGSSGPVEEFVEQTPDSFAVTGVSSARRRAVKILRLDGIEPSRENIASGTYPFFRPLYIVSDGEPQGARRDFLDWLVGPEGQAVIEAAGTVSLAQGRALGPRFLHWPDNVRNR